MQLHGPLVTLLGGAALAGVVLGLSAAAVQTSNHAVRTVAAMSPARTTAPQQASSTAPSATPSQPPAPRAQAIAAAGTLPADRPSSPPAGTAGRVDAGVRAYAGRLPDQRYALVLAVDGDSAVAYLCDGTVVESWLRGTVSGRRVTLSGPQGQTLHASLVPGRALVRLHALGQDWTFRVSAVEPVSVRSVVAEVLR